MAVNDSLKNQKTVLEHQCWNNAQYYRRDTLEISNKNIDLESKVLVDVLTKLDVTIAPVNVEVCHWLNYRNSDKKVILKFSKRMDSDNIRRSRIKIKDANLNSIGINNPVHTNSNLYIIQETLV